MHPISCMLTEGRNTCDSCLQDFWSKLQYSQLQQKIFKLQSAWVNTNPRFLWAMSWAAWNIHPQEPAPRANEEMQGSGIVGSTRVRVRHVAFPASQPRFSDHKAKFGNFPPSALRPTVIRRLHTSFHFQTDVAYWSVGTAETAALRTQCKHKPTGSHGATPPRRQRRRAPALSGLPAPLRSARHRTARGRAPTARRRPLTAARGNADAASVGRAWVRHVGRGARSPRRRWGRGRSTSRCLRDGAGSQREEAGWARGGGRRGARWRGAARGLRQLGVRAAAAGRSASLCWVRLAAMLRRPAPVPLRSGGFRPPLRRWERKRRGGGEGGGRRLPAPPCRRPVPRTCMDGHGESRAFPRRRGSAAARRPRPAGRPGAAPARRYRGGARGPRAGSGGRAPRCGAVRELGRPRGLRGAALRSSSAPPGPGRCSARLPAQVCGARGWRRCAAPRCWRSVALRGGCCPLVCVQLQEGAAFRDAGPCVVRLPCSHPSCLKGS